MTTLAGTVLENWRTGLMIPAAVSTSRASWTRSGPAGENIMPTTFSGNSGTGHKSGTGKVSGNGKGAKSAKAQGKADGKGTRFGSS
jgi:hypothetical protein